MYMKELNNFKIILVGDELESENSLFISNHLSLIDYIVFAFLATKTTEDEDAKLARISKQRRSLRELESPIFAKDLTSILLPRLKFFTWFEIWNMPSFRFWKNSSQADENWELDGEMLASTFSEFLESSSEVQWLVTFPEVNIFTEKNSKMEQIMGEKYYIPHIDHVLYPRFSGFANCIGGLYKSRFNRIYDTTIVYFQQEAATGKLLNFDAPNLLEAFGMSDTEIVALVHIHGKLMNGVPLRRDRLEKWLERRWTKKDKLIKRLRLELSGQ